MKIAFIGASGYGNVGDDSYPIVFREYLPDHECVFYNSDLPEFLPEDIGLFVIGGGGVLHNTGCDPDAEESPHLSCMRYYMDAAMERGTPYGFLSCGFQFSDDHDGVSLEGLQPWARYLRDAAFVTLRSPACKSIAAALGGRDDCRFYPDAAYLLRPPSQEIKGSRDVVTVIPAGLVNPRNVFTQHMLLHFTAMRYEIAWLGMGAEVDDAPHFAEARLRYPNAALIERPTPMQACAQIASSRFVMTGRYHGMIFARNCKVPYYVPQDSPHKIRSEEARADPAMAVGHIETLQKHLEFM